MSYVLKIALIGAGAGVAGTTLGGFLGVLLKRRGPRVLSFVMEFSAGLMLSVVCFDLVPEAFSLSGVAMTMLGLLIGISFAMLLQEKLKYSKKALEKQRSGLVGTGLMIAAGIAAHNVPEGLAIGSGFNASASLGVALTLVILIHDVPEGVSVTLPLSMGGVNGAAAVLLSALTGLCMGIGAYIGAWLGYLSQDIIALCLALAGGAMLYICVGDLIPESKRMYGGRFASFGNVVGILCGLMITLAFD